jgi:flagellar basal body P-ring formation protein FlgA
MACLVLRMKHVRSASTLLAAMLAGPAVAAPGGAIEAAVARFLRAEGLAAVPAPIDPRLRVPPCAAEPVVTRVQPGRALAVACTSPEWRVFVPVSDPAASGAAQTMAVRMRGDLVRGSVVTAGDVELAAVEAAGIDLVRDPAAAVGQRLMRSVAAGTALRLSMLELAPVVRRRDRVTIAYEGAGIAVSAEGEALEEGGPGGRVLVRNLSSGERLRGVVGPDGKILIGR